MQTSAALAEQIKIGDRVEFRQYGYKQDYACGKVLKVDTKGVVVKVDRAMRKARVTWDDLTMVMR
ncbi:MAG: hypothetical protein J6T08_01565 [Lentisphaeria bacterium]|nr:hypothetical protein [Lentisphaeria bacterium]